MTEKTQEKKQPEDTIKKLEDKIANLTAAVSKIAHMTGCQRIMLEFGLDVYHPTTIDMSKYKK